MIHLDCKREPDWLTRTLAAVKEDGSCVVENVLDAAFLEETRRAMYRAQAGMLGELGEARLARAGELGVLRLMMRFEPHFFRFLELPEVLAVVDATVSGTAIMHLQNGFILPSIPENETPALFQNSFHRDFPRLLNGYVASINLMFAIDGFTGRNGATCVVPHTHQKAIAADEEALRSRSVTALAPPGAMLVFDSTLVHASGCNVSGGDRLAINHQFTRSWIKQQIDYVRALGEEVVAALPARSQQLLGYYTRVVTSLDEYYQPEERRLYRKGQG